MRILTSILSNYKERKDSTAVFLLMSALIVDNLFFGFLFSGSSFEQLTSVFGIILFVIIAIVSYSIGLWLHIIGFVKHMGKGVRRKYRYFGIIHNGVLVLQCSTMIIIFVIALQLLLNSQYYVVLLISSVASNYVFASIILAVLSYKFLSWYRLSASLSRSCCMLWHLR